MNAAWRFQRLFKSILDCQNNSQPYFFFLFRCFCSIKQCINNSNQSRGVAPGLILASRLGSSEIKTYDKDCNRPFLKHPTLLICSVVPGWPEMIKIWYSPQKPTNLKFLINNVKFHKILTNKFLKGGETKWNAIRIYPL